MVNLSAIDLNLLVALDALLAERSVSLAAKRVGLSQPAMSNALARLRKLLDDPVLVRAGQGMEPTPRALELAAPIHQALDDLRRTLGPPPFFDPRNSPYRFRIECADDVELSLLPRLTQQIVGLAPRVEVAITRVTRATEDALRSGRSDLYLGTWSNVPASFHRYLLRQESFRCIARKGHPRIKTRLTLRAFAELGHVLCGPAELPGGVLDAKLSDEGVGRHVAVRTPSAHAVALIVARSNLIATVPRTLAETFAELLPLQVLRPPLDADGFAVEMVWHPRTHQQAPHRWLREQVMRARDAEAEAW